LRPIPPGFKALCRSFLVALLALTALARPASAPAFVTMRAVAEPERIEFPGTRQLVYRLQIAATGQDETFSLHAVVPRFGLGRGGEPIEGSPIQPAGEPRW
jgi:hypothetical protein